MDSWLLMDNDFIKSVDGISKFQEDRIVPLTNTLKTVKKLNPRTLVSATGIHSQKLIYDIPKEYDFMSQVYMKVQLETGVVTLLPEANLGCRVFKKIVLKTRRGLELQKITSRYTSARFDELVNTPLYSYIQEGVNTDDTALLTSGTIRLMVPLFFFFSETTRSYMRTRPLEPLQLEFDVADSIAEMGIASALTSATFTLYIKYYDTNNSNAISDQIYTVKNPSLQVKIPRYIEGSYNIFQEDEITVLSGATSTSLLLRCPHPTFALHISLIDASANIAQITNMRLNVKGVDLIDEDYRGNYDLSSNTNGFVSNGAYTVFFDKFKLRKTISGLIVFSDKMFPSRLYLDFSALDADYTLKVLSEHRTLFSVSDKGDIGISYDYLGSLQDQMNIANTATLEGS